MGKTYRRQDQDIDIYGREDWYYHSDNLRPAIRNGGNKLRGARGYESECLPRKAFKKKRRRQERRKFKSLENEQ